MLSLQIDTLKAWVTSQQARLAPFSIMIEGTPGGMESWCEQAPDFIETFKLKRMKKVL